MRYLSALTVMGLVAMDMAAQDRTPLRLAPKPQTPAPPKSKRQAELTERADRRRRRRNGES